MTNGQHREVMASKRRGRDRAFSMRHMLAILLAFAAIAACGGKGDRDTKKPAGPTKVTVESAAADAKRQGYDSQYDLLKDGDATKADYDEAIAQALACIRESGMKPDDPYVNRVDSLTMMILVNYSGLSDDEGNKRTLDCFASKKDYVESAYLATHPAMLDPAMLDISTECLRQRGIQLSGNEKSLSDLRDAAGPAKNATVENCVGEAHSALYPNEYISMSGE